MPPVELGDNPGPAVLGHDPVVLPDQRKRAANIVEGTGAVNFREDPLLPWLST